MDNSNKVSTTYIIDEQLYDARNEIFKEVSRRLSASRMTTSYGCSIRSKDSRERSKLL